MLELARQHERPVRLLDLQSPTLEGAMTENEKGMPERVWACIHGDGTRARLDFSVVEPDEPHMTAYLRADLTSGRVYEEVKRTSAIAEAVAARIASLEERATLWDALMETANAVWSVHRAKEAFVVPGFDGSRLYVLARHDYERMLDGSHSDECKALEAHVAALIEAGDALEVFAKFAAYECIKVQGGCEASDPCVVHRTMAEWNKAKAAAAQGEKNPVAEAPNPNPETRL